MSAKRKKNLFEKSIEKLFGEVSSHIAGYIALVLVLFALGLGGVYWSNSKEARESKARNALYLARKEHTDRKSTEKLEALIHDFDGTRSAFDARLELGNSYLSQGQPEKAADYFQKAIHSAPRTLEKAYAYSALGYAQENLGKQNDAIQSFQKAYDIGEGSQKDDLLLALARCYEGLHDSEKARSIYDQILTEFPNTEAAQSAQLFKARLH